MDIPAYLALQSAMKGLKVLDEAIVEVIQILLERIEELENKVTILEEKKNDN